LGGSSFTSTPHFVPGHAVAPPLPGGNLQVWSEAHEDALTLRNAPVAPCLDRSTAHRMMDGLMNTKIRSQDRENKAEVLIAILLFSLCMWPVVWELASAVLGYL
jgi:hypothetical protein